MITGEVKKKLDKLWDAMWSNQMTNPWIDIQQITYLIFIKMLDDNQIRQEAKINDMIAHNIPVPADAKDGFIFKEGNYVDEDEKINVPYADLRWSKFKEWTDSNRVFNNLKNNVFPFIKKLNSDKATAFAGFMKDAQFAVSNAYILNKMISSLSDEGLGFNDKDLMGDCYEYLLSKMATSGDNGQFRTPRHIIDMMVEIAKPSPKSVLIDPAMGTAGFLAESAKYIQLHFENKLMKDSASEHFHNHMFTGFDTDTDMLRIGCMNMTLHGVENPQIRYNNSLAEEYTEHDKYNLILANPPFSGSLEPETVSKSLNQISGGTKRTELLFLSLFLRLLESGGRCISIVPVGVVNNTNEKAYTNLRKKLVEEHKLEAVIYMPGGVFKPYSYDYETAVKERFLVDFHVFDRTTNLLKNGLRHSDLPEDEKEQYETLFEDEEGLFPEEIDHDEFYRRVLNDNTIDIVLNTIMTEGLRVKNGEVLGKTIIFAVKHEHAKRIVERFNILYPEKGPNFCKLVDNYVNYAQNLISEFQIPDNDFRIAVSVDMMDTGVDVQEVTNLVFFKRVFSKIKFWQMIGRGTRVRPELNVLSPCRDWFEKKTEESKPQVYEDKQGFYIFDFCDVFEFFGYHPDGKTPKQALNVSQKIFETKVDLVLELQKAEHQDNEEHVEFYKKYKSEILKTIQELNRKLINVKAALKYVDKFSSEKTWEYITIVDVKEIKKYITPLIEPDSMEEKSKLFDLWLLDMELEEIIGENDYSKAITKVTNIAGALLDKQTIPQVKVKKDFLNEIITEDFWNNISISKLEKIRTELRDLIQYLDHVYVESVSSKFTDTLIIKDGGVGAIKPSFKNYKQRVIDYLSDNAETGAIYKIRNLIPLDKDDIKELEHILCDELGTKQDYDELAKGLAFGPFVRAMVGLDVEAVEKLLNEYLAKYNFNSKQQDFLRSIVSYVLQNGDITLQDLYTHKPFTSMDYLKIFNGETAPVYDLINTLHHAVCLA